MNSIRFASIIALMLAVAGCRDGGGGGDLFAFQGRRFVFNYRVATATYLINLVPLSPVGEGQTAVARFEDPAGGEPIVVRQRIWPRMDKTTIESPPLRCVRKDTPYAVAIAIEGPDGAVLQTMETTVVSTLDQEILPDAPLVVGPVYTPNPELAGHPDGKIPGHAETCPAAHHAAG